MKMNVQKTHHIARGMSRVVRSPDLIKTVVGAGFVVVCHSSDYELGGLLHIGSEGLVSDRNPTAAHKEAVLIGRFLDALKREGMDSSDAYVSIIGGSDLLMLSPASMREKRAHSSASRIAELIRKSGLLVCEQELGGTKSRELVLDLGGRSFVSKSGAHGQASRPVSAPIARGCHTFGKGEGLTTSVDIGCMHIDTGPSRMTAILGSCVGVALWDPSTKIGALAHVMLPRNPGGDDKKAKYADTVLPPLMDSMKTMGAASGGFNAKLAGGASVIFAEGIHPAMQVGERNIEVIRQELKALQIPVVGEDVGGTIGRKMLVDLDTFRVRVKMLSRQGGR